MNDRTIKDPHKRDETLQRFDVQLPVLNPTEIALEDAVLKNLSCSGAFLETPSLPYRHTFILEFAFPGQKDSFKVLAQVTWSRTFRAHTAEHQEDWRPTGMGVRFIEFKAGNVESLATQLRYWGELRKPLAYRVQKRRDESPGCYSRPNDAECVPFLCAVEDQEIDQAIDAFMRSARA